MATKYGNKVTRKDQSRAYNQKMYSRTSVLPYPENWFEQGLEPL